MGRLDGKVSLITGGASGLGTTVAELFALEGSKIVIADIDEEKGRREADRIKANGGEAVFVPTDVRDASSIENMVAQTVEAFGRLDVAINGAARPKDHTPIADMDMAEFDDIINTNLKSVMLALKYEIKQMLEQGEGGSIVNIAAVAGIRAQKNVPAHSAAKAGIIGLTRNVALGYSPHGIRVNVVAPGAIAVPEFSEAATKFYVRSTEYFNFLSMMGRPAEALEVARAILWMASDASSFVTGAVLPVDGGFTAK